MSGDPFAGLIRSARRRPLWEAKATTHETAFGRDAIERMLPHRGAMLMLDEITAVDLDQRGIRATRRIGVNDPGFVGHFPGAPVYPAFLQLEIIGQAGICLLDFLQRQSLEAPASIHPRSVRMIKLHHGLLLTEILPGDLLTALAIALVDDELTSIFAAQLIKDGTVCSTTIMEVCFVPS